ncbi:MAG: hypothetical protein JKX95_07115, partial [Bacteroidia bacterium]|nr:hypothetical protein [Bacteroidia bacterium]
AEQQIRKSLKEKEVLLQEIHHRVKNNLQIIIGQLTLQSRKVSDEIALDAFKTSVNRVRSMALIHEKVYQSDDLSSVGFHEYIESLCRDLMRTYGQKDHIEISIDVDEINMNIEKAIPCALIINELITNSIKYAFPNESKGKITINVKLINENDVKLTVKDDGIGVPKDFDINKADSLGLMIVRNLTLQLEGDLEHNFTNGTEFSLTFPFEMNKIPEFKKSI